MDQTEQQNILDLSQQETVDVSQLPTGVPIKIGKNIIWFEDTVTPVSVLDELVTMLKQYPVYPYIIFSPKLRQTPEYTSLISNYLIRKAFPDASQPDTVERVVTDETIKTLAQIDGTVSETVKTELTLVRQREQILTQLNAVNEEFSKLDAKMHANTLTPEERARGEYLYQTQIPTLTEQFNNATQALTDFLTSRDTTFKETKNESPFSEATVEAPTVERAKATKQPVQTTATEVSVTSESSVSELSTSDQTTDHWSALGLTPQSPHPDACCQITPMWLNAQLRCMPLTVAEQLANSPAHRQYREQQTDCNGFKAVPLSYLIMLRVQLYTDGLPVVYTNTGTFVRIGNSAHDINDSAYWYPKPYNLRC